MSKDKETRIESPEATPDEQLKLLQVQQDKVNLEKARRQEAHDALVAAAELRRVTAVAETAELDLDKKKREVARELASAEENLTYTFYGGVTEESVKPCLAELGKWSRRFPGKPITIIL
ncbi:MAG: hypothetical protein JSS86_24025, partial [Cyanobacteria bacterium SZAS LIN-2]|nr:hypothetical protein [Cyanobacteria bacterium SZAS LIN-2]